MHFVYLHVFWFASWIALGVEANQILGLTKAFHRLTVERSRSDEAR